MATITIAALLAAVVVQGWIQPATAATNPPSDPAAKVDSRLTTMLAAGPTAQALTSAAPTLEVGGDGRVMVDVYLTDGASGPAAFTAATTQLRRAGLDVTASRDKGGLPVVEGWVAPGQVTGLAQQDTTRTVMAVPRTALDTGSVLSQGDAAHNGPAARALGVNGSGVVVGVISDSMNQVGTGVAGSQASGNLPASVTVLKDGAGGTDEGRAMAEIIYDEAPGVSRFYFSSGGPGAVGKANSIDDLVAHGVNVIADDIYYLDEPFFQDGVIAQAVDAAKAAGVAYFASAGNRARQSWEGTYADSAGYEDFGGGDTVQTVATVPNGGFLLLTLQWDQAWGGASDNFDALLTKSDGTALSGTVSGGTDNNLVTTLPKETVSWTNSTGAAVAVGLKIHHVAGSSSPFMKYIARGNFGTFSIAEHDTASNAINPDAAAAKGSIAVAAVYWGDVGLNDPESFSSRGALARRRDKTGAALAVPEVRQKPQAAAADGVATSVSGFAAFYGTSAATPSLAGIGALALSAHPSLTPDQLEAILTNPANTIDCTLAGNPDTDCGYGFVLADKVVAQALNKAPIARAGGSGNQFGAVFAPAGSSVALSGAASSDPDAGPSPLTYAWTQTGGPAVTLSGATTVSPSFTAPAAPATLTFQLVVNDGLASSAPSTMIVRTTGSPSVTVAGDFTGDGKADPVLFNPTNGYWAIKGYGTILYGRAGDIATPGDYNGDHIADLSVYVPADSPTPGRARQWLVWGQPTVVWPNAQAGDIPVPADYDGDGKIDEALYRPSTHTWFFNPADAVGVSFGVANAVPVPADYNGDGSADIAYYDPATGNWVIGNGTSTATTTTKNLGGAGYIPVPGNYDGVAGADLAVYRKVDGKWFTKTLAAPAGGGYAGDVPATADYDGNGSQDIARYRNGVWLINLNHGAVFADTTVNWYAGPNYKAVDQPYAITSQL